MNKKWTVIYSNSQSNDTETREEKIRRFQKFDNVIRNQPRLKEEELIKWQEQNYRKEEKRKSELLAAYDAKKLKSKALIKEARALKKKAKAKNAETA